jgi:hypothetical protein
VLRNLISLNEATSRYGFSGATLRRYFDLGVISGYRIGPARIRLDADEVEQQLFWRHDPHLSDHPKTVLSRTPPNGQGFFMPTIQEDRCLST